MTRGSLKSPSELERNPKFPAATRENQEILPSTPDEALFCYSVSREIPPPLLSLKGNLTPFMQLKNFPDIPICTREEHQVSHVNSRRAPFFPPHLKMRVHFPASFPKNPDIPIATQEEAGPTLKLQRNSRGRGTIRKDADVRIHSR